MASTRLVGVSAAVLLGAIIAVSFVVWWRIKPRPAGGEEEPVTQGTWDDFHASVFVIAGSPDGRLLACSAREGPPNLERHFIRVWDAVAGKELRTIEQVSQGRELAISADGRRLAARCGQDDGEIHLYDTADWREVALESHNRSVFGGLAFSPNGRTLASGSDDDHDSAFRLWDMKYGKARVIRVAAEGGVRHVAFSPDGATVATAGGLGPVEFWDAASGAARGALPVHVNPESQNHGAKWVGYALGGKILVTAEADRSVHLYDLATLKERAALPLMESTDPVALSPDGRTLATASELDADFDDDQEWWGQVTLWDVASAKELWRVRGVPGNVDALAFMDNRRLAVGTTQMPYNQGGITVWDVTRPPAGAKDAPARKGNLNEHKRS